MGGRSGTTATIALAVLYLMWIVMMSARAQKEGNSGVLMKYKYKFAKVAGYEQCWVCSKLHPETLKIPLKAVPVNLTELLAIGPLNDTKIMPKKEATVFSDVIGRTWFPEWCFRVGAEEDKDWPNARVCSRTRLNISSSGSSSGIQISNGTDEVMRKALRWAFAKDDSDKIAPPQKQEMSLVKVVAILTLVGDSYWRKNEARTSPPFTYAFGSNIKVCCGLTCYFGIPTEISDWCYLAHVLPLIKINGPEDSQGIVKKYHPRYLLAVRRRELFKVEDMVWTWFPSYTGWGTEMMIRLNNFSQIIDEIINETQSEIGLLNTELRALRQEQVYQRMAIESMSEALTGVCEQTINYECCTWFGNLSLDPPPDMYEVIQSHQAKVYELQQEARSIAENGWNPFNGLPGIGQFFDGVFGWFRKVGHILLMILLLILVTYVTWKIGHCVFSRMCAHRPKVIVKNQSKSGAYVATLPKPAVAVDMADLEMTLLTS